MKGRAGDTCSRPEALKLSTLRAQLKGLQILRLQLSQNSCVKVIASFKTEVEADIIKQMAIVGNIFFCYLTPLLKMDCLPL